MSKSDLFKKYCKKEKIPFTKKQLQSVRSTLKIPVAYPIDSMVESSNKFGYMRIIGFQ